MKTLTLILTLTTFLFAKDFILGENVFGDYVLKDSKSGYLYAKKLFDNKEFKKSSNILFQIIQKKDYAPAYILFGYQAEHGLGMNINCKLAATMYITSASKLNYCEAYDSIINMINNNDCIRLGDKKKQKMNEKYKKYKNKCIDSKRK